MVGGPSEVFASSGAAVFCAGMNPLSLKDLVAGCLLIATCSMLSRCLMLAAHAGCLPDARCLLSAHSMLAGAGDCCQGLFGEFLGQHVLEEEGVAENVTTPHAAGLLQETVEPFETVVLPP